MKREWQPYVDRGAPGTLRYQGRRLLRTKEPEAAPHKILTLVGLRRHNTLQLPLQPTHRVLLRWGEGMGNGLPNHDAEIREIHYDPLPPDLQERVDGTVTGSPWEMLMRRWYRTSLTNQELAVELRISRTQLYSDWRSALWYFRGRFEELKIHG